MLSGLGGALIGFGELGGAMTRVATKSGVKNKVVFVNGGNFKKIKVKKNIKKK